MSKKTFVLVHGAWHSASCWSKLIPLLQSQGHTVIAPDLPGHGNNVIAINKLSLKLYSKFLTQLIANLENKVYLVGHSMAGVVISQVAEILPTKILGLIYLSAFLPRDGQSVFDLMAAHREHNTKSEIELAMIMSDDKRSCTIQASQVKQLFYENCSTVELPEILVEISSQATLPLSGKVRLSEESYGSLKKIYICCLQDRVIPISQQRKMLAHQTCNTVIQLDSDHSPFFSVPEALAKTLLSSRFN